MAWNQDGEPPARQDTPIAGDECGARREPPEQCMQVPISGSHGVQAGEGNTQVNNYFISGQSPGWRALALVLQQRLVISDSAGVMRFAGGGLAAASPV